MFANVAVVMGKPSVIVPKQHVFLLSHMRAYTSLFGHILGSNPEICGYYEMHIGYHSRKSLIRQKLLYFREEETKPGFRYMFDKVLHNEHYVSPLILNSQSVKTIFCLRRPQEVIPSILKLYQRVDPSSEFNSEAFATNYYIQRILMLEQIAHEMQRDYLYLDAESIKQKPGDCLGVISNWLHLTTPLSTDYTLQKNTSRERFGDSSEALKSGRISSVTSGYTDFEVDQMLMADAAEMYAKVRNSLLALSSRHSTIDTIALSECQ